MLGCGLVGLLAGWWVSDLIVDLSDPPSVLHRSAEPANDAPGPLEPTIQGRHGISSWLPIGMTILGMGVLSYPVVRRLTRRLEQLQDHVTQLGEGDLDARLQVEGRDEISALARSFNRSAERIALLVKANRSLLANSSHELRSPLTRMRLALALLADNHPQIEDDRTYVEIRRSLNEMDQIIDELLTATRLQSTALVYRSGQPIALWPIIEQEARQLAPALIELPPAAAPSAAARVDPVLFRRVVRNLIENAVKYGDGRPITVTLERDEEWVELRVSDLGPGIPEAERERIFEPFYRRRGATEARGGVGLGLALVRQIAELHGGSAWCEAHSPQGSRFVCRLHDDGQDGDGAHVLAATGLKES